MSDFSNKLQLLNEIKDSPISMGIKADILKDIARISPHTNCEEPLRSSGSAFGISLIRENSGTGTLAST